MHLRYGMNPHQSASVTPISADRHPLRILCGEPSYINVLDALGAWQLVHEAATTLGRPAAASFKHTSPAGAATAGAVDEAMIRTYRLDRGDVSPVTSAYLRARDGDPRSSYGDIAAVSEPVDAELAQLLSRLVSDGIIAPGYAPGVVARLSAKKHGRFLVCEADPTYSPPAEESREMYGMRLRQRRDDVTLSWAHLANPRCGTLPAAAIDDLLLGLIVVRHTQSNSVAYVKGGMALGVGAGQQSRVGCTQLAGAKVDTWWLRRHPTVLQLPMAPTAHVQDRINRQFGYLDGDHVGALPLTPAERDDWLASLDGVSFASDGALPFRDNIDHARRHGVRFVAEPGGSTRSDEVLAACQEHGITLVHTGIRLFRH